MATTKTRRTARKEAKEIAFSDTIYFLNGSLPVESSDLMDIVFMRLLLAHVEWNHTHGGRGLQFYEMLRDKYKFQFDKKTNAQIIGLIMDYDGYREFKSDDGAGQDDD